MAVRTRAAHTLADRDSCSKCSSVPISHTADDVLRNTPYLRYTPLLSVSPIPYLLRISVLAVNNTTHFNHQHNNNPPIRKTAVPSWRRDAISQLRVATDSFVVARAA